jgi:hypothetical protein
LYLCPTVVNTVAETIMHVNGEMVCFERIGRCNHHTIAKGLEVVTWRGERWEEWKSGGVAEDVPCNWQHRGS